MLAPLTALLGACTRVVPLQLHPENAHYFLFRDKPTILISSGEHYGAVLNLDFDYRPYLDALRADGLNQTRTFAGTYLSVLSRLSALILAVRDRLCDRHWEILYAADVPHRWKNPGAMTYPCYQIRHHND